MIELEPCGGSEGTNVWWRIWRITFWGKLCEPTGMIHLFGNYYYEPKSKAKEIGGIAIGTLAPGQTATITGELNLDTGEITNTSVEKD